MREWLHGLPSSWHKSFVQKLIRFQPLTVESPTGDCILEVEPVLLCGMAELLMHPGCLTPNVRRWVTGLESFFKRLAVILPEDAYVERAQDLSFLLGCAATAKRRSSWSTSGGPSNEFVIRALRLGLNALREWRCMDYDSLTARTPISISESSARLVDGFHIIG